MSIDALNTSPFYKTYATVPSDVDLKAEFGGASARWIRVAGAGDLVVERQDGTEETIPALAGGDIHFGACGTLKSTTTALPLTVYW